MYPTVVEGDCFVMGQEVQESRSDVRVVVYPLPHIWVGKECGFANRISSASQQHRQHKYRDFPLSNREFLRKKVRSLKCFSGIMGTANFMLLVSFATHREGLIACAAASGITSKSSRVLNAPTFCICIVETRYRAAAIIALRSLNKY